MTLQKWCVKSTDFTALQNMGLAIEHTCELQETDLTMFTHTCVGAQLTFTSTGSIDMTEWQTRWWLDFIETQKTKSGT